jgi:hypothetical protein
MHRLVVGMLSALVLSCTAAAAQTSAGPRPSAASATTPAKSQYLMAVPSQQRPVEVKKTVKKKKKGK